MQSATPEENDDHSYSTTNDKSKNNADGQGSKRGDKSPDDSDERKPPAPQSQGLFGGIFGIFHRKNQPTRMKLPDDKNPTVNTLLNYFQVIGYIKDAIEYLRTQFWYKYIFTMIRKTCLKEKKVSRH